MLLRPFFKEKGIPLSNISSCATDGEPARVGHRKGFLGFLRRAVPSILAVHCVIHRQHLVAKNLSGELHSILNTVIKAVNKNKVNALNGRLFKQLCIENDEVFENLVMHTEVRWISKGNCLKRFSSLCGSVIEFLEETDADLSQKLKDSKHSIAYLTDIFGEFNCINKQLQGNEVSLITAKTVITQFRVQLQIMKFKLSCRDFSKFVHLSAANKEERTSDADIKLFIDHLSQLHTDMNDRFKDLVELHIPKWVCQPFLNINLNELEMIDDITEELLTIQNDCELEPMVAKSYRDFWLQKEIAIRYPALWGKVQDLLIAFPTSYLVERGGSAVAQLLGKQRLRLDIVNRGDLRLNLTNIEPDLEKIISNHQAHPSHGKPSTKN